MVARGLACPRGWETADGIRTPCSVAHELDRQCKGEQRNGHGNLDKPFPAATRRPPGPLDVALICTSKVEKAARLCQGTGAHLPAQLEGRDHEPLAAPSSPEAARSIHYGTTQWNRRLCPIGHKSLTSHVAVPSCPSFQLHFSCEGAALWSDRRSSSSKGGWEEECRDPCTETCPSLLKMLEVLVLHCEV